MKWWICFQRKLSFHTQHQSHTQNTTHSMYTQIHNRHGIQGTQTHNRHTTQGTQTHNRHTTQGTQTHNRHTTQGTQTHTNTVWPVLRFQRPKTNFSGAGNGLGHLIGRRWNLLFLTFFSLFYSVSTLGVLQPSMAVIVVLFPILSYSLIPSIQYIFVGLSTFYYILHFYFFHYLLLNVHFLRYSQNFTAVTN